MRSWLVLLLFIGVALNAQTRSMNEVEAKELKALVKTQADATQTISSDFIQFKHLDFLSNDIESVGKLSFKTPDLVKWEYVKPFAYSVLFKNETLFINNEGDKSNVDIGSNKLFKQLNTLIANSIKGDMFDSAEFDISYFKKNGQNEVHFEPKDADFSEFIKAFHITFNKNGEVAEVKMVEPSGDYTQIIFSNREVNKTLPNAVFDH